MDAYIYKAALLCKRCAKIYQSDLEVSEDSNTYPQGPHANGGGRADCPMYCDHCGLFLENPLTIDGVATVRAMIRAANPMHPSVSVLELAEFYKYELCDCGLVDPEEADSCLSCWYANKGSK